MVDISEWVIFLFSSFIDLLYICFLTLDRIIIFSGAPFGLDYNASLLDFCIGILVVGIVLGAFYKINRPDTFYSER